MVVGPTSSAEAQQVFSGTEKVSSHFSCTASGAEVQGAQGAVGPHGDLAAPGRAGGGRQRDGRVQAHGPEVEHRLRALDEVAGAHPPGAQPGRQPGGPTGEPGGGPALPASDEDHPLGVARCLVQQARHRGRQLLAALHHEVGRHHGETFRTGRTRQKTDGRPWGRPAPTPLPEQRSRIGDDGGVDTAAPPSGTAQPRRDPLVEPGAPLTSAEVRRYARHLLVPEIGVAGQRRLKAARVLVVGAGGLGSPALLYLAAAGVGTIGVLDDDVVEESNLQRQVVHTSADLGRAKVDSAADAVARTNPLVTVVRHRERLTPTNAAALVAGYDLVLDGADNFPTRYVVDDACVAAGLPWVWGAVLRFDGHVAVFDGRTGPTYRDLFPRPPAPGAVPSCAEAGVLGGVCAQVGSVMATEAVKLITGAGASLLGRVLVVDALAGTWRTLGVRSDPARAAVAGTDDGSDGGSDGAAPTAAAPDAGQSVATVTAADLERRLADPGDDLVLVDVRESDEHARLAVPGARLVPLAQVLAEGLDGVAPDAPVVLHCAAGTRSARALVSLRERGFTDLAHLEGGITAWVVHGGPVVEGRAVVGAQAGALGTIATLPLVPPSATR